GGWVRDRIRGPARPDRHPGWARVPAGDDRIRAADEHEHPGLRRAGEPASGLWGPLVRGSPVVAGPRRRGFLAGGAAADTRPGASPLNGTSQSEGEGETVSRLLRVRLDAATARDPGRRSHPAPP